MTDQRARFEEWHLERFKYAPWWHQDGYPDMQDQLRYEIWQAATAAAEADKWAAVRRCAEICESLNGSACNETYDAIQAEFPEAFPVDPNKWAFDRGLESA